MKIGGIRDKIEYENEDIARSRGGIFGLLFDKSSLLVVNKKSCIKSNSRRYGIKNQNSH